MHDYGKVSYPYNDQKLLKIQLITVKIIEYGEKFPSGLT